MARPAADPRRFLDPRILARVARLDLKARLIVEGFLAGRHRSPFHGASVEFAAHREYAPGDDLRHVNWKVFARSDRVYIKQYEEETNLKALILLDASESMAYGSGPLTKHEYGATLAAALIYLLLNQQDAAGLALFDGDLRRFVPPSRRPGQLAALLREIEEHGAPRGAKTDLGRILDRVAEKVRKRGLIVVISDLFDDPARVLKGLHHLRHRRHEVIVFQILDPHELEFPFAAPTLFQGLEEAGDLAADAAQLRAGYLARMGAFLQEVRQGCLDKQIDCFVASTGRPLDQALAAFLAARSRR